MFSALFMKFFWQNNQATCNVVKIRSYDEERQLFRAKTVFIFFKNLLYKKGKAQNMPKLAGYLVENTVISVHFSILRDSNTIPFGQTTQAASVTTQAASVYRFNLQTKQPNGFKYNFIIKSCSRNLKISHKRARKQSFWVKNVFCILSNSVITTWSSDSLVFHILNGNAEQNCCGGSEYSWWFLRIPSSIFVAEVFLSWKTGVGTTFSSFCATSSNKVLSNFHARLLTLHGLIEQEKHIRSPGNEESTCFQLSTQQHQKSIL